MRTVDSATAAIWAGGDYTGDKRPIGRATIVLPNRAYFPHPKRRRFASLFFSQTRRPRELPNIKNIHRELSTDGDTATATITLYNTRPLPLGATPAADGDVDIPGYYTPKRGLTAFSSRWGHTPNYWKNAIVEDAIVRTFAGYGCDPSVCPELDPHMYPTGVWLVDDVAFTSSGLITVTMRDIGAVLIEDIAFPPVINHESYPISFQTFHEVPDKRTYTPTSGWVQPTFSNSSITPYVGRYGSVHGHHGVDAFDSDPSTYWLSTGNGSPDADYSFEWIEGKLPGDTIEAVKFHVWGGPYHVYVSVYVGGQGWLGRHTVPYNPDDPVSAPNGADIPFIRSTHVDRGDTVVVPVGHHENVKRVRITFANLCDSGIGPYVYRAGCRRMEVAATSEHIDPLTHHTEGNYGDYTDIVRLLLAWGGWFWPAGWTLSSGRRSNGDITHNPSPTDAAILGRGNVWGHLETSHTAGIADLGMEIFDKKPMMDGINYVRDILGFIFFRDENGGAIFRSPNIWEVGNYRLGDDEHYTRTSAILEIDERITLLENDATSSGRNKREKVVVANVDGKKGAVRRGLARTPALRRVAIWTDQHFKTKKECLIMADLIAVRQMFTVRADTVRIPGHPGIQIDDQVRVYERVTNEGYLHYIKGMTDDLDHSTGKWIQTLETHWLGEHPFDKWVFDPSQLAPETQAYLHDLGKI